MAAATEPSDDGMMSSKLYLAVCAGRNEEALELLASDQAGGIYHVSAERNNVLHLAAEQGRCELILEVYNRFADRRLLSSPNSALDTPLHCAARAGRAWAVSLLIQLAQGYGEQTILWCKNKAGDTALHLAARFGHAAAVEALVRAAPELASEVNDDGVSPLYLAVMSRSVDTVKGLTTICTHASATGLRSQNALHAAVFQGSEMVSILLKWKPSLASEPDDTGSTPLHFASSDGDPSIISAILGANPSAVRVQDSGGLSALHVAAAMGHARVVKELMEVEKCPDAAEFRDSNGRNFLHAAARGGHRKVVELAIIKPTLYHLRNAQDVDGNTPLHLAVTAGASDVVEYLMCEGELRAHVLNKEGHTPFDLAAKSTSFFSMLRLVATLAAFGAQSRPQRRDQVEKWNGHAIAKGVEKTSDSLAVVAVLIATVAFTAGNSVPGSHPYILAAWATVASGHYRVESTDQDDVKTPQSTCLTLGHVF
uniref:Uncharacterized protein n=1 Tax=Avena sativa TaxID=4498 RepID=A0ACD5W6M8_AVESA